MLHIYSHSAAAATTTQNIAALLLATCGITTKLTGSPVSQASFGSGTQGFHASWVHAQVSHACSLRQSTTAKTTVAAATQEYILVFCWPKTMSSRATIALASFLSNLLCSIMGPVTQWMQDIAHLTQVSSVVCATCYSSKRVCIGILHGMHQDDSVTKPKQDGSPSSVPTDHSHRRLTPNASQHFDALMQSAFRQLFDPHQQSFLQLITACPGATPAPGCIQQVSTLI